MVHQILLYIILFLIVLIIVVFGAVIYRRVRRQSNFKKIDRERETYAPQVAGLLTDSSHDFAQLRKKPGSIRWTVIEEEFFKHLDDATPDKRAIILDAFSELGYIDHYINSLGSVNHWNRAAAAEKLGRTKCARSVPFLIKTLDDKDRDVRNMAIDSLGHIGDPVSIPALVDLLEKATIDREEASATIVESALIGGFGKAVVPHMAKELKDPSWRIRAKAVEVFAELGVPEAMDALREALYDNERDVRAKAAKGLGNMGDTESVERLIELTEDDSWVVRLHATRALKANGSPAVIETLKKKLTDSNWQVRNAAAIAFGHLSDEVVAALTEVLTYTTDRYARDQVLEELQRSGMIVSLIDRLGSDDEGLTAPAAKLLITAGCYGVMKPLLKALTHREQPVRLKTIDILGKVGGERVVEALRRVAKSDLSPAVKEEAERVAGSLATQGT